MIWVWVAIIAAVIVGDVVVGALAFWSIARWRWRPVAMPYPEQPPRPDAVTRRFQSFRFGSATLPACVHVAVDEEHLHLTPIRPLRWFGATTMSLPWEAIAVAPEDPGGPWLTARLGELKIQGPRWCLELAAPPGS